MHQLSAESVLIIQLATDERRICQIHNEVSAASWRRSILKEARMEWEPVKSKKAGKKRGCLRIIAIAAVVVLVIQIMSCVTSRPEPLDWPTSGLATLLPDPPTDKGKIISNSDDQLSADVAECSSSDFAAYVEDCKEAGFTIDAENDMGSYEAYSEEGAHLDLYYYESQEEISITLDAPIEMGTLSWPKSGAGALVPAPESAVGEITSDSSDYFVARVGETDSDAFQAYIDACADAGFTVDYDRSAEHYYAEDAEGVSLSLDFEGFNTMGVTVDLPDDADAEAEENAVEEKSKPAQEPKKSDDAEKKAEDTTSANDESKAAQTDANGVSLELKAQLDEFEKFFDEYVAFMEKYDADDPSMYVQYATMMTQYTESMEALDAIDEESLSLADQGYYVEVMGRITQKLASVEQ